jgi:hypothetical protein
MTALPKCRWRKGSGRINGCDSPRLVVLAGRGVPADYCRVCPYVDHEPGEGEGPKAGKVNGGCRGCLGAEEWPAEIVPGVADPLAEPEQQRPPRWAFRSDVRGEHVRALQSLVGVDWPAPARVAGSGIVTMGEGEFWPGLVAAVKVTRETTDLPIQVWGDSDRGRMDRADLDGIPGLTFHDVADVMPPPRSRHGWANKTTALLNCGLRAALWIDADAYFLADPSPLLDLAASHRWAGWQDRSTTNVKWEWTGLDARRRKVPPLLSGQFAIDLAAFRRELCVAHWMNQHGEYFWAHMHGDQDSLRIALCYTRGTYHLIGGEHFAHVDGRVKGTYYRFGGRPLVSHRVHCKLTGDADEYVATLPGEDRVFRHLKAGD